MIKRKIVIIGAGKVAHSLTPALVNAGYKVECVISKNPVSAKALAKKISISYYSNSLQRIPANVNVFFITVPDGEIKKVAEKLSKSDRDFKNCIFIHFSGVQKIEALHSLKRKGASIGSVHLMQTFPSKRAVSLRQVSAAIETGDPIALKFLNRVSKDLHLKPFRIDPGQKELYHLAGVFASNFLAGNLFSAENLLHNFKISRKDSFNILKSTIISTLHNIEKADSSAALSGPVERGDFETVKLHISALKKLIRRKSSSDFYYILYRSYIAQSLLLLDVVSRKYGRLKKEHRKIRHFLSEQMEF